LISSKQKKIFIPFTTLKNAFFLIYLAPDKKLSKKNFPSFYFLY